MVHAWNFRLAWASTSRTLADSDVEAPPRKLEEFNACGRVTSHDDR
jgi:hypothetical protein